MGQYDPMPADGDLNWGPWARGAISDLDGRATTLEHGGGGGGTSDVWNVNVLDYASPGVNITTGATDASSAFQGAFTAAISGRAGQNVRKRIVVPPGTYLITQQNSLFSSPTGGTSDQLYGLTWQGFGPRVSQINFSTAFGATTDPRLNNLGVAAERLRSVQFNDLSFTSNNPNNNWGWFWSVKPNGTPTYPEYGDSGQNQAIEFNRCMWEGPWKRVLGLDGTGTPPSGADGIADNNSEWYFNRCRTGLNATFADAFLKVGDIEGGGTNPQQNQFLNFLFDWCEFSYTAGTLMHFAKGGKVTVRGGSWSSATTGTTNSMLWFKMPNAQINSSAVTQLLVEGVRFEPKSDTHKIIDCNWQWGQITFRQCIDTSSLQNSGSYGMTHHTYGVSSGGRGPTVTYDQCAMVGGVQVNGAAAQVRGNFIFRESFWYRGDNAELANAVPSAGTNPVLKWTGGAPSYRFQDNANITDQTG